jgi:hypothetical protein
MTRTALITTAVLLVLAAGAAWWWNATFVRAPTRVLVGSSGEARLRPFLAVERFAERMGMKSRELRATPELDSLPVNGVLLLPGGRQALEQQRLERLLAWVQGGGHLIAEAEPLGTPDALFDQLAVRRIAAPHVGTPLSVLIVGRDKPLKVTMPRRLALEPPTGRLELRASSGDSLRLATFARGHGKVTVVSGLDFARNPRVVPSLHFGLQLDPQIGDHDHAALLWRLMQAGPATELAVYWHPVRLSLWGFLTENAAAALTASFALLVMWLWRIAPRFGPVAPDAPPARRRLLDHLRASGRYYWALDLRERLLIAARDAALRRVLRAQPEFAAAPPPERAARLAALASVPVGDAQRLLDAGGAIRGAAFIQVVQTAQRVHAALERGNR